MIARRFGAQDVVGSAVAVIVAVAGVALPLDFLTQIDGYLMYLRPWELLPVFGWAWLFYTIVGLLLGLVLVPLAALATALLPVRTTAHPEAIADWLGLSVVSLALTRATKLWIESHGWGASGYWMSKNQLPIVILILLACTVLVARAIPGHRHITRLARIGALVGLAITVTGAGASLYVSSRASLTREPRGARRDQESQPNIFLFTIDALAANHLSDYGYSLPTAPQLEAFVAEAHLFERYYANSNFTTPSVNSLISGVRPWTHRANRAFARPRSGLVEQGLIARVKAAGYVTLAIATNPIASPSHTNNDQWVDVSSYGNTHDAVSMAQSVVGSRFPHFIPTTNLSIPATALNIIEHVLVYTRIWHLADQFDPELPLAVARRMIGNAAKTRPLFVWVHLLAPHSPYASTAPYCGFFDHSSSHRSRFDSTPPWQFYASRNPGEASGFSGRYDEAIRSTDAGLGTFLAWLRTDGLYENALIIVTADHGESFSHGYGGHGGPLLHDDLIHIPLIIKEPRQKSGTRQAVVAEQIDLSPTILDLVNLPIDRYFEGRSLKPVLRGERMSGPIFSMNFEQSSCFDALDTGTVAMINGPWKYVHYFGAIHYPMMPQLTDALYDTQADPHETSNVIDIQPSIANEMREAIEGQLRTHGGGSAPH